MSERFRAVYLIETPLEPARVAEVLAGEQSSGTFVKVRGETAELEARARATVASIEELPALDRPSLPNAWLDKRGAAGPWRRAHVAVDFPVDNIGDNLATLAATVAGNLYDLGETTGLRLVALELPASFRTRFPLPAKGVAGTRTSTGVQARPLLGTIIKPNLGLSAAQTGALVGELCDAGIDFVKDDEVCANPVHAPLELRVREVMSHVRAYRERTGRNVMVAFNITDETDRMRRHADLVASEGGSAVMASLNWCGLSAIQSLRASTDLVIHGHRNGFGMFARDPALGMSFQPWQAMWRLAGVDHLHVHGIDGKFADDNATVASAARDCLAPVARGGDGGDAVLPVFSSGQWAGTLPQTWDALRSADFLFLSGGGILAHPDGPAAGVTSLRAAWDATLAGISLAEHARGVPALARALAFYGK